MQSCSQGVFIFSQADVFKSDFTAERDARSRLATDKDRLSQELEAEQLKNQGLTDQLTRYTQQQLQDMQLRANQGSLGTNFFTYPHHYPTQQDAHQHAAGYVMGGGGDGLAGGNFNNLSAGEGGHVMHGQNYGGAGQNYGAGQNLGGGQNYLGGQQYPVAGREGSQHQQAGHNMPMQATSFDPQYGGVHPQHQHTQVGERESVECACVRVSVCV